MNENCFERFVSLLEDEKVYLKEGVNFGEICELAGADPSEMELFLEETFGVGGDDVVRLYKEGKPIYFL
ncbi:MAG: hypothetical protein ACI4QG_07230 [Candidatus Cryptobacteroides sp.]